MKKINTHSTIVKYIPLALVVIVLGFAGANTFASNYTLSQTVLPNVIDVCPNIPGDQTSIPSGMLIDGNGDCYTPTPPTPDPPVDLCSNLIGVQSTLPEGYYRTNAGQCYLQPIAPAQPVDVCSNIDGVQESVPPEHYLDSSNRCMPSPIVNDICKNIPGIQAKLPEGMVVQDGNCSTPPTPSSSSGTNNGEGSLGDAAQLKNVPGILQPVAHALVDALPENTVKFFKEMPEGTVQKIPSYVFVLVLILIIIPLLQSIREAIYARQIAAILKRERSIAEQKDNFVSLASHYLRTPLTVMRNGLELIISIKEASAENTVELTNTLNAMDADISQVLSNIENNDDLKDIKLPLEAEKPPAVLRSGYFWSPIVLSVILTLLANFFLGVVGDKEIGTSNTLLQVVIFAVFIGAVYMLVRNIRIQKHIKSRSEQLVEHEKTVDEMRNNLISEQTDILKKRLDEISRHRDPIKNAPSYHIFEDGFMRFAGMLEKFLLLGQIQTGTQRTVSQFNIRDAVEQVLFSYQSDILAKDLRIVNAVENITISQNEMLFNFVISSLIDNAIRFNKEGGTITLSSSPKGRTLSVEVSDNGIGIDNEKLDQLFKPFSRATSAVEFNYEGLGFSLFLNKLIMDYTGGTISALADPTSDGTRMVVTTPVNVSL